MKLSYLLSVAVTTLLLIGCDATTREDGEEDDDLIIAANGVVLHHQGESCMSCHGAGSSNEVIFDSGATIFTTIDALNGDASNVAQNYSLRLVLASLAGTENYIWGRGTGNFHATLNAGITNYTVEILDANANVVNSSQTNSHTTARFDCNSCHTSTGANGAPGRILAKTFVPVTVPTTTTTTAPQFANDVQPILTSNCAGCHGNSGTFSITNNPPYTGTMQFVDTTTPTNSRLLQKGKGIISHTGGVQLSDSEYITIRDWISAGALND